MKKIALTSVVAMMIIIAFFAAYTKSSIFRTKYNNVENKICETVHEAASKVGINYPNCRVLNDDEIVVKIGGNI